jgi:predicted Rossmann-fold nucleotide-binding protein
MGSWERRRRGAGRAHSFGPNIRLPSEQQANEFIKGDPKLITLNYFFTRKLNFVKEAHAFAMFPGGFGTLDETFEVLTLMQTGKARIIPCGVAESATRKLLGTVDGVYYRPPP